jgi:hypothetical protein
MFPKVLKKSDAPVRAHHVDARHHWRTVNDAQWERAFVG